MMEITTEQLNAIQLLEGTKQFIKILTDRDFEIVDIEYGYQSREDHEYSRKTNIAIKDLPRIINEGTSDSIIKLGLSDFFIRTPEFEYQICNDSDLHLRSDNANLINHVKSIWEECGFKVYPATSA